MFLPVMLTARSTCGHAATKEQLRHRPHRIEGQVRGIERMVDEDRRCTDVITECPRCRRHPDQVALGLPDGHTRHCVAVAASSVGPTS